MKRNQLRSGFAFARFEYTSTYIIHILNISIQAQPLQHMESCKMSRCSLTNTGRNVDSLGFTLL